MKQFKDAQTPAPDEFAIEAPITDCYSGYPPGIALLEDMLEGRTIVHAGCHFHLRKYFVEALSLLKNLIRYSGRSAPVLRMNTMTV